MDLTEMRALRTLLSGRAEIKDNYLFQTRPPHMSNLTVEQIVAFETIASVDSSVFFSHRQGHGSPSS